MKRGLAWHTGSLNKSDLRAAVEVFTRLAPAAGALGSGHTANLAGESRLAPSRTLPGGEGGERDAVCAGAADGRLRVIYRPSLQLGLCQ